MSRGPEGEWVSGLLGRGQLGGLWTLPCIMISWRVCVYSLSSVFGVTWVGPSPGAVRGARQGWNQPGAEYSLLASLPSQTFK